MILINLLITNHHYFVHHTPFSRGFNRSPVVELSSAFRLLVVGFLLLAAGL